MKTFFEELKNRRVYRVAIAYVIAGSATVQVVGTVLPIFHAPDWAQQLFVVLIALGFPFALVLAWSFDVEAGTIKKAGVGPGSTAVANRRRVWIVAAVGSVIAMLRSEEHTSELQSQSNLVCRLLLEKKKKKHNQLPFRKKNKEKKKKNK